MYNENYLASRLARGASGLMSKHFISRPEGGVGTSYAEFFGNAERYAALLADAGVKAGDNILVYAPKSVSCIELYFGCLLSGAVYTPINPSIPGDEIGYFVEDAAPPVVVCGPDSVDAVLAAGFQGRLFTISSSEEGSLVDHRDRFDPGFQAIPRQKKDRAAVLYTSGTTGKPKGVIHTHGSLWSNADVLANYWQFAESDVLLHVLPIFHLHGLFTAMNVVLSVGASCVFLKGFDVKSALKYLPQCTVMMGVPPYYMALLGEDGLPGVSAGMRVFISGSAPMLPQTHASWKGATGQMILERYGMTECSMIASNPYDGERRANSVGFPLPGTTLRIVDIGTGEPLPAGEVGMIQIKGENLFAGYLNKPEKTAEDMTDDGFFISGDYGRYDQDGYLYVLGRVKDAVITNRGLVIPKSLEEVIDTVDGVDESAVIAVRSSSQGVLPVAVYSGSKAVDYERQVLPLLRKSHEAFAHPVRWIHVERLPRNTMGKVQKAALREEFASVLDGV